jgi:hypothetical protein
MLPRLNVNCLNDGDCCLAVCRPSHIPPIITIATDPISGPPALREAALEFLALKRCLRSLCTLEGCAPWWYSEPLWVWRPGKH